MRDKTLPASQKFPLVPILKPDYNLLAPQSKYSSDSLWEFICFPPSFIAYMHISKQHRLILRGFNLYINGVILCFRLCPAFFHTKLCLQDLSMCGTNVWFINCCGCIVFNCMTSPQCIDPLY